MERSNTKQAFDVLNYMSCYTSFMFEEYKELCKKRNVNLKEGSLRGVLTKAVNGGHIYIQLIQGNKGKVKYTKLWHISEDDMCKMIHRSKYSKMLHRTIIAKHVYPMPELVENGSMHIIINPDEPLLCIYCKKTFNIDEIKCTDIIDYTDEIPFLIPLVYVSSNGQIMRGYEHPISARGDKMLVCPYCHYISMFGFKFSGYDKI